MLILDTDLLTIVQSKAGDAYARLASRLESARTAHAICVTIISLQEQMRGWLSLIAKARKSEQQVKAYARLHTFVDDFAQRLILDYDERAVRKFEQLARLRPRIGTLDLRIAAIALAYDATLLSRNLKDFRKVPGLTVEDWTS